MVLTGASSGLGKALSLAFAQTGAKLVLAARRQDALDNVAQQCRDLGADTVSVLTDVTDAAACERLMTEARQAFGGVDVVVLCAGISMWARADTITDPALYHKLVSVNYLGAVYTVHAALDDLKNRRGLVVAISSIQGQLGVPYHAGYGASKFALQGFVEGLEAELEGQLRFLTVYPSWIRGTELRQHALSTDASSNGNARRAHSKNALEPDRCSRDIIEAIRTGKRRLYLPGYLRFIPWLKLIAPGLLRAYVRHKVDQQAVVGETQRSS